MFCKPFPYGLHGHEFEGYFPHLGQLLADARERMPIFCGIGDPHLASVRQRQTRSALNVDKERIDRAIKPAEFKATPLQSATIYRLAVKIRCDTGSRFLREAV